MLTAFREHGNEWRGESAELPSTIIWLDLVEPTVEEQRLVERRVGIRMPTREALSEIEASSRLVVQRDVLYLSTPAISQGDNYESNISPIGFVLTSALLVTIRYSSLPTFDSVAERVRNDEALDCGVGVFVALLEALVGRGADVPEHIGTKVDALSRSVFHDKNVAGNRTSRKSNRMRHMLTELGIHGDTLAQARDVILGVGRIASFVSDIAEDWIPDAFRKRLAAVSKDVVSLNDYETHLTDKVQFLLDAVLGYISIEQNDLFKILTIVSVIGVPPTLLAGIWGMNFHNMPELTWQFGYPLAWLAIVLSAVLPLVWFKLRGWF
jgi:magnesium transporter